LQCVRTITSHLCDEMECLAALSEATTVPAYLEALGLPSPPNNVSIGFGCETEPCILSLAWSPSLDSGVGPNSSTPLPLNYSLRIYDMQQTSIPQSCPPLSSILTRSFSYVNDATAGTSATVSGLSRGNIYCVYLRAQNNRLQLYSDPTVLMARPISPPLGPTQLSLLLNPLNFTNLTSSIVPGSVVWMPPTDAGAGVGIPVPIAAYELELYPCAGPGINVTTTTLFYSFDFVLGCNYVVRLAARNLQDDSLGAFSAWGPYQTLSVYVAQVAAAAAATTTTTLQWPAKALKGRHCDGWGRGFLCVLGGAPLCGHGLE
jgi:hypothetical protein